MKNIVKLFLIVFILQFQYGCRWFTDAHTPFLAMTDIKIPAGTPVFQQGFRDGCSSVIYARGNVLYRTKYKYRYDPKMISHPEYVFGHRRGYSYCFNHMVPVATGPNASPDKYLNLNASPIVAGNYNNVGLFGGTLNDGPVGGGGLDGLFRMWSGTPDNSALGAYPTWGGGSKGQFFGQ